MENNIIKVSEVAKSTIESLRADDRLELSSRKSNIADAMSVITDMITLKYASQEDEDLLSDALSTLSDYNRLLTHLSKE